MQPKTQNPIVLPVQDLGPLSDAQLEQLSGALAPYRVEVSPSGQVEIMSPPSFESSRYELLIATEIEMWVRSPEGSGKTLGPNVGVRLDDRTVRAPDTGWLATHQAEGITQPRAFLNVCPVFVVEVKSPSDTLAYQQDKCREWLGHGAEVAWLVNPETRLTHVLRRTAPETFEEVPFDQPLTAATAMTGFSLTLADLPL